MSEEEKYDKLKDAIGDLTVLARRLGDLDVDLAVLGRCEDVNEVVAVLRTIQGVAHLVQLFGERLEHETLVVHRQLLPHPAQAEVARD